jgi:hypothetical protein
VQQSNYKETSALLTMQIKSKVWLLYKKDKHITQLAMENDRKFSIPPACFGQAGPQQEKHVKYKIEKS